MKLTRKLTRKLGSHQFRLFGRNWWINPPTLMTRNQILNFYGPDAWLIGTHAQAVKTMARFAGFRLVEAGWDWTWPDGAVVVGPEKRTLHVVDGFLDVGLNPGMEGAPKDGKLFLDSMWRFNEEN